MKQIVKIIILIFLLSMVANADECNAYNQKGSIILKEAVNQQSFNKAHDYLVDACSHNCLGTCNLLGILYHYKNNHNQYFDIKKGDNILLKACDMGHGISCINMAKRDNSQDKILLLNKAIKNKAWQAYYYLGNLFFKQEKYKKSIQMYKKACSHQVKDGCVKLAYIYHNGTYVVKNLLLSDLYVKKAGYTNYSEMGFTLR